MVVFPLFSIYIFFCPEKIEKKKKYALFLDDKLFIR